MAAKIKKKTKTEWCQDIVNDYIAAGEPWPPGKREVAAWAILKKRWTAPKRSLIDQCAQDLADAMGQEMKLDPQGRTVHAKRCATIKEKDEDGKLVQRTIWFDESKRTPKLFRVSQAQWKNRILGECRQHRIEEDSFNDNNPEGVKVQMSLDFEKLLRLEKHSTEYNPPPFDDGDEDEEDFGDGVGAAL